MDDFAKSLYLPRFKNAQVILDAIQGGVGRLTWRNDTFAYAGYYEATADRYRDLEAGRRPTVQLNSNSVVVKPEIAADQIEKDSAPPTTTETGTDSSKATGVGSAVAGASGPSTGGGASRVTQGESPKTPVLRRFHGSATIAATSLSRDIDVIASSVVQHLAGLLDAKVKITIEIEAEIPSGAPENVVRTVTENCRTLKFENQWFEES